MAALETEERILKNSSSDVLHSTISKELSPESKCPICLDCFKNISYLNVCLHKFCYLCIREWSKNKAECPLCKQPFNSIYHTIKAENDYKRFDLRPTENGSFGNVAGQRFRYRTTLTGDHRPAQRRTSPPPDHGIIFESLNGSIPQSHNSDLRRTMRRLAARQRLEREGRSVQSLREQEIVKFRRALYRRGVRVQSVQDGGRIRDTSAEFFKKNPACLHRLVPWLRRELTVLYGTHGSFVNILQHIIMTLITRHDMNDQAVLHELRPFLLSHTEHFLHEFLIFAKSPFNVEAYDQHAVYDLPGPSTESSGSETSVIAISEDESDPLMLGAQDFTTPRVTLSQTPWDDETPGPSYSLEPSEVFPFHVRDSDSDSTVEEAAVSVAAVTHQDHSFDSDDCVIVGYVKPVTERTPELVQLSSDSEEFDESGRTSPRPPQYVRFTSQSPSVTQRPSQSSNRGCYATEDTTHLHASDHNRQEENYEKRHHERQLSKEGSSFSSRTHSSSHSRKNKLSNDGKHKRRRESHSTSSYWHSSSRYGESGKRYTETSSSYTSYYRSRYNCSLSRSRSRRRCKDRQDRSRSLSNSRISSTSSNRRSRSRSNSSRLTSQHDEYSRKKKYKTKHLEEHSRKSSGKSHTESGEDYRKKKKKKKHHKKSKKKSRSPSIDTVYDDISEGHSRKHHKKRKKHGKKSKRHKSTGRMGNHSPDPNTVTTNSDSGDTDSTLHSDRNVCAVSSTVIIPDRTTNS